jgi:GST-like protein
LLSQAPADRYAALQWLMFQMGGVGPMFGQYGHFHNYAPESVEYAKQRYANEVRRLHGVLDKRLAQAEWLAGAEYSIADIATYPWLRFPERRGIDLADYPNVKRWFDAIDNRPAVQRGVAVLAQHVRQGPMTPEQKEILFGKTQFQKR